MHAAPGAWRDRRLLGRAPNRRDPEGWRPARAVYSHPVDSLLLAAAKPWTYWLALPLTLLAFLGVLGVIIGYLLKAVAAKYPRQ